MFSFFQPVIDAGSRAFDWMEANPNATKFIGGIVGGAATGYMNAKTTKDQQKREMRMLEKRMAQDEKFKERRASSNDDYDSHVNNLVGGTGLLAPVVNR